MLLVNYGWSETVVRKSSPNIQPWQIFVWDNIMCANTRLEVLSSQVRETHASLYNGGPNEGPRSNPSLLYCHNEVVLRGALNSQHNYAPIMLRDASLSDSQCNFVEI